MISKKTVEGIVLELKQWEGNYARKEGAALSLLKVLADVKGNKSFCESIKAILKELEERR